MRYLICAFILGLCCAAVITRADEVTEVPVPTSIESACLEEINRVRAEANLPELQFCETAFRYARRSAEIQFKRRALGHMAPTVGAEVCATGNDPINAVARWLRSPGHRGVILGRSFTHIGTGNAPGYMVAQLSRGQIVETERSAATQYKTVTKHRSGPLGVVQWKVQVRVPVESVE